MLFQASNDRTIRRHAAPLSGPEPAFKSWLHRQVAMLDAWEAELLLQNAAADTLNALQSHKDWIRGMLETA